MDPLWLLLTGMIIVVGGILFLRLHAFLALVLGALVVGSLTTAPMLEQYAQSKELSSAATASLLKLSVGERIADGFGGTCAKIGILIAMASIIGICLMNSGAAEKIVRSALRLVGEKRAPLAFLTSGFALGTPVFFDTVFYLMIPLGKMLSVRNAAKYGLYIMTIVAGATMAHSLVPPTPGPLYVAGELNVSTGAMMLGGITVGLFTVCFGYLYAVWANTKFQIPLRNTADVSVEELEKLSQRDESALPSLWLSLLPIILPVVLIAGNTIVSTYIKSIGAANVSSLHNTLLYFFNYIGNPNVALTISALIALSMVVWNFHAERGSVTSTVQTALSSAGQIILITAAGGAFGGILQQTGIAVRIQELAAAYQIPIIPLAFFVTALVRTAQGSATVAMITAVGILGGLAEGGQLGFHPLYLALAIGCGSKPFLWMNDSGFWVMCKMSGMTEKETLKTVSVMMIVMSIAGLAFIMLLAKMFPLV